MPRREQPLQLREVLLSDADRPDNKMLQTQAWPMSESEARELANIWRETVRRYFASNGVEFGSAIEITAKGHLQ